MDKKRCPKCDETKELDEFYKCKSRKDGHTSWCKECHNKSHKNYVCNNIERIREYERFDYYKNHEEHKMRSREYAKNNKEKVRQSRKEYYERNREKILTHCKLYNQEHKDKISARNQAYYESHKEDFLFRARERKRKIRETKDGTITKETLDCMYEQQFHKCDYCGSNLDEFGKHLDHILPLAKGGIHTLSNVHWVCPKCNLSKNDQTEKEWFNMLEKQNKMIDGKIIWDERSDFNEGA